MQLLLLAIPALASEWVAVRATASHCVQTTGPQPDDAPCVRLAGGAVLARVEADRGDSLHIAWERTGRSACLDGPSPPLSDLDLVASVSTTDLVPVISRATTLDLGAGVVLQLQPGQPAWPAEEDGRTVIKLAGLDLWIDQPLPTARSAQHQPGTWPTLRPVSVPLADLPLPEGLAALPVGEQPPVAALWDQDAGAVVLQDACARLVLPTPGGAALGRPGTMPVHELDGRTVQALIPEGTVLTLPSGRAVGRTTAALTIGPNTSPFLRASGRPGSQLTSPRGGRTCFSLPTSPDPGLPWAERNLELCAATATLK